METNTIINKKEITEREEQILNEKPFLKNKAIEYAKELQQKYKKGYVVVTDIDILIGNSLAKAYHIVGLKHFVENQRYYNFVYLCL